MPRSLCVQIPELSAPGVTGLEGRGGSGLGTEVGEAR